jgi:hypothetical protein
MDHGGIVLATMTGAQVYAWLEHECSECYYSLTRDSGIANALSDNLPRMDSPNYLNRWMERYLDEVHDPDVLINRSLLSVTAPPDIGDVMMPCLDVACVGVAWMSESEADEDSPIHQCPECGGWSCVPISSLIRGGDSLTLGLAALARSPVRSRVNHRNRWRFMIDERQDNPEVVELVNAGQSMRRRGSTRITFGFNREYFQRDREHFIRARANFETLSDIMTMTEYDMVSAVGWNVGQLLTLPNEIWDRLAELVRRISADPTAILDEGRAESIRTRLVDEEWGNEEYRRFLRLLAETGILRDSSGEDRLGMEFWIFLYKSTLNRLGLRPVVKRTGRVTFPTDDVIAGITLSGIEKSWRDYVTPGTGTVEEFFDETRLGATPHGSGETAAG